MLTFCYNQWHYEAKDQVDCSDVEERARQEKRAKTTRGRLKKIPNCPGLYRHASGKYYMIRKIKGKIVVACLDTTDQATAKRILQGKTQTLQLIKQGEIPTLQNLCARFIETKEH